MRKQDILERSAHLNATYKPEIDTTTVDVSAVHQLFAQFLRQDKSPELIISDNLGTTSSPKSKLPADLQICVCNSART